MSSNNIGSDPHSKKEREMSQNKGQILIHTDKILGKKLLEQFLSSHSECYVTTYNPTQIDPLPNI